MPVPILVALRKMEIENFIEQAVFQRDHPAIFIERMEVGDDLPLRGGHLHRLHRAEELADEAADDARRAPAGPAIFADALGRRSWRRNPPR